MSMKKAEDLRDFLGEYLDITTTEIMRVMSLVKNSFHFICEVGEDFSWELFETALALFLREGGEKLEKMVSCQFSSQTLATNGEEKTVVIANLLPRYQGKRKLYVLLIYCKKRG